MNNELSTPPHEPVEWDITWTVKNPGGGPRKFTVRSSGQTAFAAHASAPCRVPAFGVCRVVRVI